MTILITEMKRHTHTVTHYALKSSINACCMRQFKNLNSCYLSADDMIEYYITLVKVCIVCCIKVDNAVVKPCATLISWRCSGPLIRTWALIPILLWHIYEVIHVSSALVKLLFVSPIGEAKHNHSRLACLSAHVTKPDHSRRVPGTNAFKHRQLLVVLATESFMFIDFDQQMPLQRQSVLSALNPFSRSSLTSQTHWLPHKIVYILR